MKAKQGSALKCKAQQTKVELNLTYSEVGTQPSHKQLVSNKSLQHASQEESTLYLDTVGKW